MSTPKANRRLERLSRYLKQKIPSRRTATSLTGLEPSKKTASPPLPAPAKTPACPECQGSEPELVNEPLNRVLIVDRNSPLANVRLMSSLWLEMNLILSLDYGRNSFNVLKNRWGPNVKGVPLDLLATFLYHPEITDANELSMLRIEHNNQFATTESEQ